MDRISKLNFRIYSPSGNPTAIVEVLDIPNSKSRKAINDEIMSEFDFVEQVGFVDDKFNLTMAGGERCINAIRCAAYHYMRKFSLEKVDILNLGDVFGCGYDKNKIFTISNFSPKFSYEMQNNKEFIVNLGGITHIVNFENLNLKNDELKQYAFSKLKFYKLLNLSASGFINFNNSNLKPVVYVRDIDTLFYESACGSGSVATSVILSLNSSENKFELIQPSGKSLFVEIYRKNLNFDSFKISGEIEIL